MRLLHRAAKTSACFDDPNLVSHAGLVLAVRLAQNVGLDELVEEHVRVAAKVGVNPGVKIGSLIAGMVAGVDTIDGMDLLRHGALPATFGGIRAPSTLGSFLRAFDHGNVAQLAAVHRRVLVRLAEQAGVLPVRTRWRLWISMRCNAASMGVYGATKQGAAFGHAKIASKSLLVRGLNALITTVSTPTAAPGRRHRHHRGPRRLGLLRRYVHRRVPAQRGPVLGHRAARPQDPPHDQHHSPGHLGVDQIPQRHLRRRHRHLDLRCPDPRLPHLPASAVDGHMRSPNLGAELGKRVQVVRWRVCLRVLRLAEWVSCLVRPGRGR